ncbi:MAG: RHS repeat domain-containing protein, partial [Chlamydiia bacterium]
WSYDLNGRVSSIDHPAWSGEILAYTDRGQISQWQINDQSRGAVYNGLGHVVGNTDQAADRSYGVNGFGQRTSVDGNPSNPDPFGHPQAHLDQQLSWSNEGRLQQIAGLHGETTCRWDALGRMVDLKHGRSSMAMQYDHRHRCSRRTVNQTEQNHLFTGRYHLGYVQGDQEIVRLLLPGACETGCMIARIEGDQVQEVLCDLQGSVVWVEGKGTTTYDVFGVSSQPLCEWGYRSKWTLAEVGWVDFGRRIYAPELGIFVSPDPKGVQEGWWDHHYCDHAPLGRMDPWGEEVMPLVAKAIGVVARCTPMYWARSSSEFYTCFPEDCGGQWPQSMNRFMEKQGRKDIYIVCTGINNSIEDHHRAVQGVATAAMAKGNAAVIGIYRPDILVLEGLYACADAWAWQLPSPATRGVYDGTSNIIRQAQAAGDFGECKIHLIPHSAGTVPANTVGDALADMGVIHQADVLSMAGACPIMKDRPNGSFRSVKHVYSLGDPVSHFGSALRDKAMARGIDCGEVEWVSVPEGADCHGFWAPQHLDKLEEETGLHLDFHFAPTAPVSSFIPRYEPALSCLYPEHEKIFFELGVERAVA